MSILRADHPVPDEQFFTVQQIAKRWNRSADYVRRKFRDEVGVMKDEHPETRGKRSYTTLRIPPAILKRVEDRMILKGEMKKLPSFVGW